MTEQPRKQTDLTSAGLDGSENSHIFPTAEAEALADGTDESLETLPGPEKAEVVTAYKQLVTRNRQPGMPEAWERLKKRGTGEKIVQRQEELEALAKEIEAVLATPALPPGDPRSLQSRWGGYLAAQGLDGYIDFPRIDALRDEEYAREIKNKIYLQETHLQLLGYNLTEREDLRLGKKVRLLREANEDRPEPVIEKGWEVANVTARGALRLEYRDPENPNVVKLRKDIPFSRLDLINPEPEADEDGYYDYEP
jgi:hypothetical protein